LNTANITAALLEVIIFWGLTTPHEYAHAWVAEKLGDDTPRNEGRVTLNPIAHVDWLGTVLLPLLSSLFAGGFLGWGKAVNTNPYRLRWGMTGLTIVALAGPASNVVMAALLALAGRAVPSLEALAFKAAYLSLYLAVFNMLPVPPLDGSKFLLALRIPAAVYIEVARFGFIGILVLMFSTGFGRWMASWSYRTAMFLFGV
jgi:Zn-dependent protease